jgi:hypothetical protein
VKRLDNRSIPLVSVQTGRTEADNIERHWRAYFEYCRMRQFNFEISCDFTSSSDAFAEAIKPERLEMTADQIRRIVEDSAIFRARERGIERLAGDNLTRAPAALAAGGVWLCKSRSRKSATFSSSKIKSFYFKQGAVWPLPRPATKSRKAQFFDPKAPRGPR